MTQKQKNQWQMTSTTDEFFFIGKHFISKPLIIKQLINKQLPE
jgi:hypothetical protein